MAELKITHHHPSPTRFAPGVLLALIIAAAAIWLGNQPQIAALGLGSNAGDYRRDSGR